MNAATNSGYTGRSTMNRFAAMQLCPEFTHRAAAAAFAALVMSASARTMNGSLPPSSRTVFFTDSPATLPTAAPAASLPVSVTARIRGSWMSGGTAELPRTRLWNTPFGNPASVNAPSISREHRITLLACLRRATFPAMRLGATNRNTCQNGKFHGITARIGPRGSYRTKDLDASVGIASSARNAAALSAK